MSYFKSKSLTNVKASSSSSFEEFIGRMRQWSLSLPTAFLAKAAHKEESTPPEIPRT